MKYSGSCHCGKVAFDVDMEIDKVMSCNCSRCRRLGSLLAFTDKENFTLKSGEGVLKEYLFNKHAIHHQFCANCGIQPFAEAVHPKTGKPTVAVNVRCLEGVDLEKFEVMKIDGASF
jgi:hypothetical protein